MFVNPWVGAQATGETDGQEAKLAAAGGSGSTIIEDGPTAGGGTTPDATPEPTPDPTPDPTPEDNPNNIPGVAASSPVEGNLSLGDRDDVYRIVTAVKSP